MESQQSISVVGHEILLLLTLSYQQIGNSNGVCLNISGTVSNTEVLFGMKNLKKGEGENILS